MPSAAPAPQRLLTHEQELDLARTMEQANRRLAEALSRSPTAVRELIAILEETERTLPAAAVQAEDEDETDSPAREDERRGEELLGSARRLRAFGARHGSDRGGKQQERARADLVATAIEHGVPAAVVDRLLTRLLGGPTDENLAATIQTIRENQRTAERAKAVFVRANLGLVTAMARRRANNGLAVADLVQEGSLGLIRAVEKFDHRRGLRFSTYAAWWIRHALNRALSDQSRTIRLPVYLFENRQRFARLARDFTQEHGREPTPAELSQRAAVSEEKIHRVASLPLEPVSLETPIADNDTRLGDLIADPAGTSVLDDISLKQIRHRLQELVHTLPPREQRILRLRFGTDGSEPLTLQQIAQKFSLSRERIRQIELQALSKLREQAADEDLDSHLAS